MNSKLIMHGEYKNYVALDEINRRIETDPKGFVDECEWIYGQEIDSAADMIASGISRSRIVMLAGPSGSGKTTSARRIRESLEKRGVKARTIEMDSYFLDVDKSDLTLNYEMPERLDLPLMIEQMDQLAAGKEVWLPKFDFITGKQIKNVTPMCLGKDEVAIFEGIHALNDIFRTAKTEPVDIYVSVRMRVTDAASNVLVEPEQMRFLRRGIRDMKYRGADFNRTLSLWKNVIDGEKAYIMPFKKYADIMIDTSFDYEVNLLAQYAMEELKKTDPIQMTELGMGHLEERLKSFAFLDPSVVPADSMLREFVGEVGLSKN